MRPLVLLLMTAAVGAQSPSTTTLTTATPHVALQAMVEPEVVPAGGDVTLTFDVTPARRIKVYAPGAEYQVIAVKLDAQPGLTPRKAVYPPSEIYHFEPLDEHVPVYQKPFTLKQAVSVGAEALRGKSTLTLSGTLEYQACDDRVCFKPNAIPFKFEVRVKKS
jgi:hypothetical protein